MPLYEFLLEFVDRTEVRIGDRGQQVGDAVTIAGRAWLVEERLPGEGRAEARFLLQPLERKAADESTHRERVEAALAVAAPPSRAAAGGRG